MSVLSSGDGIETDSWNLNSLGGSVVVAIDRAVHLAGDAVHCINGLRVVHESFFRHRRASLDAAAMADIVCGMCGLKMGADLEFTFNTSHVILSFMDI